MLDLTSASKKLYEIKMPDGQVLTLKLPTQKLLMRLMDMQKATQGQDPMEVLNSLTSVVAEILNLNTQGAKFTAESVADMLDFSTMMLVVQDYFNSTAKTLGE